MEDQSLIRSAKTVEEAIELATLELGVGRDEIEGDVISNGRAGILGIGSEPAKVRVQLITETDGVASDAIHTVREILSLLNVEVSPTIRNSGKQPEERAIIDIQGEDAGLIIGKKGETLRALQMVVNMIINNNNDRSVGVIIDVEKYRDRRYRELRILAERTAQRVRNNDEEIALEPMPAGDRRVIHSTLSEFEGVETISSGEGIQRKVTIRPVENSSSSERKTRQPRRTKGRESTETQQD